MLSLLALQLICTRFLDDGDYASENATRNIFNWHKETEDGAIWLDMSNDLETRKYQMHPWIHRESSEYESVLPILLTLVLERFLIVPKSKNCSKTFLQSLAKASTSQLLPWTLPILEREKPQAV